MFTGVYGAIFMMCEGEIMVSFPDRYHGGLLEVKNVIQEYLNSIREKLGSDYVYSICVIIELVVKYEKCFMLLLNEYNIFMIDSIRTNYDIEGIDDRYGKYSRSCKTCKCSERNSITISEWNGSSF